MNVQKMENQLSVAANDDVVVAIFSFIDISIVRRCRSIGTIPFVDDPVGIRVIMWVRAFVVFWQRKNHTMIASSCGSSYLDEMNTHRHRVQQLAKIFFPSFFPRGWIDRNWMRVRSNGRSDFYRKALK